MTQKLREQISALCDHELPEGEHELLLRRFSVEKSLRLHWERYHLIGAALRKELPAVDSRGLADRVMAALHVEAVPEPEQTKFMPSLLRGFAGMAIAATVAVVAIVGIGRGPHRPAHGEIVPANSLARSETSPVNLMNDANWSGQSVPVQASLDDAVVDQEGVSPALGKQKLQGRSQAKAAAPDAQTEAPVTQPPRQE
ncbi:MAG TPA: sigma-E factor negative regulatory protein [Gammaproteobacteria bacterium]|jgi:sigma-E factor negative regulatory protein RseA